MKKDMSGIELRELRCTDGLDVYNMLQTIGAEENEFHNDAYGLSFEEFKSWLKKQYNWSRGIELPEGYVKQWIFWMYVEGRPVGFGKLRERLTEHSKKIGGNIGYAISSVERGKGYGTVLFGMLLNKAKEMKIETVMSTVEKGNPISKRIQETNGGILIQENDQRWYFSFDSQLDR